MKQTGFSDDLIVQESWGRINALSFTYYQIAEEEFSQFLTLESAFSQRPVTEIESGDFFGQDEEMIRRGIKTIVFSAMCLEAAASDMSAIQLGDDYAKKHIDKLDILSKWVVVPRIFSGKSLKEDGPALNALRSLVRDRNSLVHHKSRKYEHSAINTDLAAQQYSSFRHSVHNSYKAIVFVSLEMCDLLDVFSVGLPPFEGISFSSHKPIPHIKKIIDRCREINKKAL